MVIYNVNVFILILMVRYCSAKINTNEEVSIQILHRPVDCEVRSSPGDLLILNYIGTNQQDGQIFDSSSEQHHPKQVRLGPHLMLGWEQGLEDMCVGEKREVIIPPGPLQEGGTSGMVRPSKGMTAVYLFELLEIRNETPMLRKFHQMDRNDDQHISMNEMMDYYSQQGSDELGPNLTLKDAVKAIFSHQDINKDGLISKLEFEGKTHDEL